MTTQKERIAALEQRVDVLEQRMTAPAKAQHYAKTTYYKTPTKNTPAPPVQLKELTADELAFCKKFGINTQSNKQSIQLQAKQLTEQDRQALHTLKQKRLHTITIFN